MIDASTSKNVEFRQLYAAHSAFVWRVLRRLGVSDADLEDVCQEAFVTVYQRLPSFEGRSAMRTWIYGIAFRCASEHRRRGHVKHEVARDDLEVLDASPDPSARLDRVQRRELLDTLLDRLDPDTRAVVIFFELEGLSMNEVAAIVGCPVQTAYWRLHNARRELEAAVQRLHRREVR